MLQDFVVQGAEGGSNLRARKIQSVPQHKVLCLQETQNEGRPEILDRVSTRSAIGSGRCISRAVHCFKVGSTPSDGN